MQSSTTKINNEVGDTLFDLVVWVFSDKNQNYIEEGYNILNLLLYKL